MGLIDYNCAVADSNTFVGISNCIVGKTISGDVLIGGLILLLIVALVIWRQRLPLSATVPIATILVFGLSALNPVFNALWLLAIVANAVLLVVGGVLTYARG